jgi:hypothetical protein
MSNITTAEASGFIPEIWLATALGRLRNYLTLQKTVTMDTELPTGETFTVGKTLHLPKRGTLVVNDKAETGNYTVQNPQSSTVDLVLNKHPEVTFALTSEVIAFQNQDQGGGYVNDAMIALAERIDLDLFAAWRLVAAANTITNASTITEANILSARKILRDNKVRPSDMMFGVVSTAQEAAILQLTNLVRYDAIGVSNNVSRATIGDGNAAVTIPGAIGRAYGFEVAPTQLVPNVSANDNTLQTVTIGGSPTGGTFVLALNSISTGPIAYNASASAVQAACVAAWGLQGLLYVSGSAGGPYTFAFLNGNTYAITHTDSFTGGSSPAITVAQVSQTTGAKNLFYTKDFLLMASRSLPLPQAGTGALGTTMTDPDTGITMRLVKSWNANGGYEQITIDLLYGFSLMRPEHGVLIQTN